MHTVDLSLVDLEEIFQSLDVDRTGNLDFKLFLEAIYTFQGKENNTLIGLLKFRTEYLGRELGEQMSQRFDKLENMILSSSPCNGGGGGEY